MALVNRKAAHLGSPTSLIHDRDPFSTQHKSKHILPVLPVVQSRAARARDDMVPCWKVAEILMLWGLGQSFWWYTWLGNSAFITLVARQHSLHRADLPILSAPYHLVAQTLESWLTGRPLGHGSQCTPKDQPRLYLLWVSESPPNTSSQKVILLHPVGASYPQCFCSFDLILKLYPLHSITHPQPHFHTSGQHSPPFNHYFDKADLKGSLLITFGKAPWNISAVFKRWKGSSRLT